jgi:peptidoglycan/xylan/chitin deacetylase (PgdA/CDA1 family)
LSVLTYSYYALKPLIPRPVQILLRRRIMQAKRRRTGDVWPIDAAAGAPPRGWAGWPGGKKFALVLGHDVDTAKGRDACPDLMDLERRLGFVSCFNFVAQGYEHHPALRQALESEGFEIGVHGLKHDGRMFSSRRVFDERAPQINDFLRSWRSVGFCSPSMYRNLDWLAELEIEYGCSTFDTDPFEPQPEGAGTIFPFVHWRPDRSRCYVEIPYTMPQDHTLFVIFREKDISIWKTKLDWLAARGGLVRMNVHPDYMAFQGRRCSLEEYPAAFYEELLSYVKTRYQDQYWHVLPRDLARFWRRQDEERTDPSGRRSEAM